MERKLYYSAIGVFWIPKSCSIICTLYIDKIPAPLLCIQPFCLNNMKSTVNRPITSQTKDVEIKRSYSHQIPYKAAQNKKTPSSS